MLNYVYSKGYEEGVSEGVSPRRCKDGGAGQVVNNQRRHELANGSGLSLLQRQLRSIPQGVIVWRLRFVD